jgi:site-specific recombinase XerD
VPKEKPNLFEFAPATMAESGASTTIMPLRQDRRTCARLCRKSGGDLEQIQFLLGHSSIQTTEKYLGGEQDIVNAVNDRIFARVKKFQSNSE